MRTTHCLVALGGLLGVAAAVQLGCWSTYDDYYLPLTDPRLATTGSGGHDGGTGTGGTGGIPFKVTDLSG